MSQANENGLTGVRVSLVRAGRCTSAGLSAALTIRRNWEITIFRIQPQAPHLQAKSASEHTGPEQYRCHRAGSPSLKRMVGTRTRQGW